MKKGSFKKFLAGTAMGMCALAMPFAVTGCDKEDEINVRFQDNYFQWQIDGDEEWNNLITIDEIKNILGDGYKGESGIDGREIEFQKSDTHIQWRYKTEDNSDEWKNLIEISELQVKTEIEKYTINFDYQYSGFERFFENYKVSQEVQSNQWLIGLPTVLEVYEEDFDGWYIKGTDKKIANYDFIGGNVVLEARWKTLPSGLYFEGEYKYTWTELVQQNPEMVSEDDTEFKKYPYIESIGDDAVIVIDKKIKVIGEDSFHESNVSEVIIPEGVTTICSRAFSYNSNLKKIVISKTITNIDKEAFWHCTESLESIVMAESNEYYKVESDCLIDIVAKSILIGTNNSVLPDGDEVEFIDKNAFWGCSNLKEINISKYIKNIGENAFYGCVGLEIIKVDDANEYYRSEGNCLIEKSSKTLLFGCNNSVLTKQSEIKAFASNCFEGFMGLEEIVIPNNVETFGSSVFKGCANLKRVDLSNSLVEIPEYTFEKCVNLENITIPESVKSIGYQAFYNCSRLIDFQIPENVEEIGSYAFYECTNLKNLKIFAKIIEIPSCCFALCENLKTITFSNTITNIGSYAFSNCKSLEVIEMPESVEIIDISAFQKCTSLKTIVFSENLLEIKRNAFYKCEGLKNIILPKNLTNIDGSAFSGCSGLVSIEVDKNNTTLQSVNNCVVEDGVLILGCKTSVIPTEGVSSIAENAFRECLGLEEIIIPENITSVGYNAFYDCKDLKRVTLKKVIFISQSMFEGCENLETITIPNTVKTIYGYAFRSCTLLTEIIFKGLQEEWEAIDIDKSNTELLDGSITIKFEPETTE